MKIETYLFGKPSLSFPFPFRDFLLRPRPIYQLSLFLSLQLRKETMIPESLTQELGLGCLDVIRDPRSTMKWSMISATVAKASTLRLRR